MMLKAKFIFLFILLLTAKSYAQNGYTIDDIRHDLTFFTNETASAIKKSTTTKKLNTFKSNEMRQLASAYLDNTEANRHKLASYHAILSPQTLGEQLSIGNGYSRYENVTGIYLRKGEHIILASGITENTPVEIWVANWNRRAPEGISPTKDPKGWGLEKIAFKLGNGANVFKLDNFDGLAYVHYYSDHPDQEKPVTVHFVTGEVNGYFDSSKHTDKDWNALLDNAIYPIIDAFGKHIQIAYPVEDCKKYAYDRGLELLNNYDTLVAVQHRLIGLEKYNRIPKNRILSRVNYNYYMFRDQDGVAYMGAQPGYALNRLIDPHLLLTSGACWGFSHEVGHVHQLRPYFNWAGMGEVSNNVMTMYATIAVGQKSNLGNRNHYEKARDSIINKGISYLEDPDVMNRLVPFWQLHLYFSNHTDNQDFYPDLFEAFRVQAANQKIQNPSRNPAIYQLNFVLKACEVSQTDLTSFFEAYGFFKIAEFHVKDYRSAEYVMTQEMVDVCKGAIKAMNIPQPTVDISRLQD